MGIDVGAKHRYWLVALAVLAWFQVQPAVAEDFTQLRKSAEQGDAAAHDKLRHAAEQGDPEAQWSLGRMYEYGKGVAQDHREAVRWYRKAAEQGHASAQYNLGWMYATGKGVAQHHGEAEKWFRRAAQPGNAKVQKDPGFKDRQDEIVAEDARESEKRYRRAAKPVVAAARNKVRRTDKRGRPQAQDKPGRARTQGVAARSRELVDLEVVTSEPMQVWINGKPVKIPASNFAFTEALPGSNRLTIAHKTDKASVYRVSSDGKKVAMKVAAPRNGENRMAFDVSVDAFASFKIDVESSPTLFEGEMPFGFYHLVRDREHTIPFSGDVDVLESLGVGCREIAIRTTRREDSFRKFFRRRYLYWVELEASLCGTPSSNGAVKMDISGCSPGRPARDPCWFYQKFSTAAGTLKLSLGYFQHNYFFTTKKNDLSKLPRLRAWARIELE